MYVLGIRGRRFSGKDFFAKNVLSPFYGAKLYAFADELKRQVKEAYALTDEHVYGTLKEAPLAQYPVNPKDPLATHICQFFKDRKVFPVVNGVEYWNPRLIMIAEGQFKRSIDPDYWVNFLVRKIRADNPDFAVITDVRMPETEGLGVKQLLGGKVINILRPVELRGVADLDDPSETAMDNWPHFDATIHNQSDIKHLSDQTAEMFKKWGWNDFHWMLTKCNDYSGNC